MQMLNLNRQLESLLSISYTIRSLLPVSLLCFHVYKLPHSVMYHNCHNCIIIPIQCQKEIACINAILGLSGCVTLARPSLNGCHPTCLNVQGSLNMKVYCKVQKGDGETCFGKMQWKEGRKYNTHHHLLSCKGRGY